MQHHDLSLDRLPAAPAGPRLQRRPIGDLMQPAGQGTSIADRGPVPRQCEEGGLECILGVMFTVEDMPANPQDPWAMALDQDAEGILRRKPFAINELG